MLKNRLFESIEIASKILEIFKDHCSFDGYDAKGPKNPGDLLKKYGKKCDYSIRPKSYNVDVSDDGVIFTGVIKIEWETWEVPIENAVPMIKEALDMTGLTGFMVKLHVYDMENYEHTHRSWSI